MNAATRILSPTGIITSEDRSQVLEHAAEILAYMRNHPRDESCSPECGSVQGVLAAALLCMSDDVAKLDREESAHEGALATAELKAAYCTRQSAPAAMVALRRPKQAHPLTLPVVLYVAIPLLALLIGMLAKC